MREEDEIFLRKSRGLDHLVKKGAHQGLVFQPGLQKPVQHILPSAGCFLFKRKLQVKQIFAGLSAQRLPEDFAIFFHRGLFQSQEGLVQLGYNLSVFVHITAPDPIDPAVLQRHQFTYFRNCFFIQKTPPPGMILFFLIYSLLLE